MAIEVAFQNLNQTLWRLHEVTRDLTIALREDQPNERAPAAQRWADNAENLHGLVYECKETAASAGKMLGASTDLYNLRRDLTACQRSYNGLVGLWLKELVRFERVEELAALGQRPKREWQEWTRSVRIALECCYQPVEETATALLGCWQELAERVGGVSVSVNSVGIGRQFNGSELPPAMEINDNA